MFDYILETTIEDLQLLFGEVGLGLQLLETLRPVGHCRHLQLFVGFICEEEEEGDAVYTSHKPSEDFNNPSLTHRQKNNTERKKQEDGSRGASFELHFPLGVKGFY